MMRTGERRGKREKDRKIENDNCVVSSKRDRGLR